MAFACDDCHETWPSYKNQQPDPDGDDVCPDCWDGEVTELSRNPVKRQKQQQSSGDDDNDDEGDDNDDRLDQWKGFVGPGGPDAP